MRGNAQLSNII